MLTAKATIAIPTPARYMARLCNHFAHRGTVHKGLANAHIEFPNALSMLQATDDHLEILLEADDAVTLERLQEAVGRHLKQVASAETFEISWNR